MNRLTVFVYLRFALATAAFAVLVPLLIPVVEFPLMLLVAIVSRLFGAPDVPNTIHDLIYKAIYRPEVFGVISLLIGFFVLRFLLSQAIGKQFGGKVLVLQDSPASAPQ